MPLFEKIARMRKSARDRVRNYSSTREMQRLLRDVAEPVVFDVGANEGNVARKFRERFPGSTVYCFEPFEETYAKLVANTADDPRIHCFNYGLTERDGEQSFHANARPETNSLLPSDPDALADWGDDVMETQRLVTVPMRTLDSVIDELALPRVDLLKLDVQGAEHLVMRGAERSCRTGKIGLVFAEIITQPAYAGQLRFDEALGAYYDCGFDLHNLYTAALTDEGKIQYLDAIFTRDQRRAA